MGNIFHAIDRMGGGFNPKRAFQNQSRYAKIPWTGISRSSKQDQSAEYHKPRRERREVMSGKRAIQSTRRGFLKTGLAGAAAFSLIKAESAHGAPANSKIEVGIIGSGGRGHYVSKKMMTNAEKDIQIVAAQDPFADRLESLGVAFDVDKSRWYQGVEAYHDLLALPLDAVAVTSPPYFHPEQVAAAVKAGKHVWLAKPVAVDAPGCQSILASAKQAEGRLTFLVDFQTRNSPAFKECVQRVHEGAIGELVMGHVYYHTGRLNPQAKPGMPADEARLRNWVFDIHLSGDIIVEQNVHVLDVANWYIGAHPLKAFGTGGRKARVDVGDCWDHFIVTYEYPNGVKVDFSSTQFVKGYDDMCIRMYGTQGTADSHYWGVIRITGDNPWHGTDRDNTMDTGVDNNVLDFVKAIRGNQPINHGAYAVETTLTGVLGRMAAYEGREVTWDDMLAKQEKFEVQLKL